MSNNKLFMESHELAVLNRYYIWLTDRIDFDSHDNYSKLVEYLFSKNYIWKIWTDENRNADGINLREKFKDETDYLDYSSLVRPCSVLEMLIAFAERINVDVMDEEYSTSYWFWLMLNNLGFKECTDDNFDAEKVDSTLNIWMNREFDRDGKGGIFPQISGKTNQKNLEYWFQMQQYISERFTDSTTNTD